MYRLIPMPALRVTQIPIMHILVGCSWGMTAGVQRQATSDVLIGNPTAIPRYTPHANEAYLLSPCSDYSCSGFEDAQLSRSP